MEILMSGDEFIVSKTDLKGRVTYCNKYFIEISGYEEEELLNVPHSILRHEEMPRVVFQLLWERIQGRESINAYVKNKTKNGDYYWVFANVTASLDVNGNIIGYYSVRRKPSQKGVSEIERLYRELLDSERESGVHGSLKLLESKLYDAGVSYDEFVIALQR